MAKDLWFPCKLKENINVGRVFDFLTNLGCPFMKRTFDYGVWNFISQTKENYSGLFYKNTKDPVVFLKEIIKNQRFFKGYLSGIFYFENHDYESSLDV